MTKNEYDILYKAIHGTEENRTGKDLFRWELLKVLWEIRDALKGNLE